MVLTLGTAQQLVFYNLGPGITGSDAYAPNGTALQQATSNRRAATNAAGPATTITLDALAALPVAALARRLAARDQASTEATVPGRLAAATAQAGVENSNLANVANLSSGKKCPECGAHAQHRVDGCLRCANCHHIGSCG